VYIFCAAILHLITFQQWSKNLVKNGKDQKPQAPPPPGQEQGQVGVRDEERVRADQALQDTAGMSAAVEPPASAGRGMLPAVGATSEQIVEAPALAPLVGVVFEHNSPLQLEHMSDDQLHVGFQQKVLV
jgi:hypothetical protein